MISQSNSISQSTCFPPLGMLYQFIMLLLYFQPNFIFLCGCFLHVAVAICPTDHNPIKVFGRLRRLLQRIDRQKECDQGLSLKKAMIDGWPTGVWQNFPMPPSLSPTESRARPPTDSVGVTLPRFAPRSAARLSQEAQNR